MSKPGDIGWTLTRYTTDESGVKRVEHLPLPNDPRPVIAAGLKWKTATDDGPDGIPARYDAEDALWDALEEYES